MLIPVEERVRPGCGVWHRNTTSLTHPIHVLIIKDADQNGCALHHLENARTIARSSNGRADEPGILSPRGGQHRRIRRVTANAEDVTTAEVIDDLGIVVDDDYLVAG